MPSSIHPLRDEEFRARLAEDEPFLAFLGGTGEISAFFRRLLSSFLFISPEVGGGDTNGYGRVRNEGALCNSLNGSCYGTEKGKRLAERRRFEAPRLLVSVL